MLSIIMPVYKRTEYTKMTIYSIQTKSEWKCELIILVDWTDDETIASLKQIYTDRPMNSNISIRVHVPMKRVFLTPLRNTWLQFAKYNNVIVINDDVLLSAWFDTAINEELAEYFFVCPKYTEGEVAFNWYKQEKRWNIAGRCRAIKKSDRNLIWPIDERLKIRYNDDRLFRQLSTIKENVHRSNKVTCHHFRSQTIDNPENKAMIADVIKQDEQTRMNILKEQWRFDERFNHLIK